MLQEKIKEIYNKIEEESEWTWRYEVFEKYVQQLQSPESDVVEKIMKDFSHDTAYWKMAIYEIIARHLK
jgi:hypothetical protein